MTHTKTLPPLPKPDLQVDPCSVDGKKTDYYAAETVRRLLAAQPVAVPDFNAAAQALGDVPWPPGYCLDPNGVMCAPEEAGQHYLFGYEIGFREAMAIKMRAIDALVAAQPVAVPNPCTLCGEQNTTLHECANGKGGV